MRANAESECDPCLSVRWPSWERGALGHNQDTWHCATCLDRNFELPWYSNILRIDLGHKGCMTPIHGKEFKASSHNDAGRAINVYLTRRLPLLHAASAPTFTAVWLARCPCNDCYISVTPRHSPGETQGRLYLLHLYLAPTSVIDVYLLPPIDRPGMWLIRLKPCPSNTVYVGEHPKRRRWSCWKRSM